MIGSRDPDEPGFNRALDALRPIGSLVKPFVYLVALAQPQTYSLATLIEDSTVDLPQPNGSHWQPQNDDHETHGNVLLIDALVHSWNLATVHLGMRVGVDHVRGLLQSFGLGERSIRIRRCCSARSICRRSMSRSCINISPPMATRCRCARCAACSTRRAGR